MFQGSVKGTGYPFHSPVSPSLPLPCVTVCHHVSTGVYLNVTFIHTLSVLFEKAIFLVCSCGAAVFTATDNYHKPY